jgi:uncharacterized membrane protein (UPF0127 family)
MRSALVAVLAVMSVASCSKAVSSNGAGQITSVVLRGAQGPVRVTVTQADTAAERQQGLMGRTSLRADEGMIFLWSDVGEGPVTSQFWMKDTLIPLSIAFWDDHGRIVGIQDMAPCTEDPCQTYGSPKPYVGALEVNEGFFSEHGVTTGDRIALVE